MNDLVEALAWAALEGALRRERAIANFWEAEAERHACQFHNGDDRDEWMDRWCGHTAESEHILGHPSGWCSECWSHGAALATTPTMPCIVYWHAHRRTR